MLYFLDSSKYLYLRDQHKCLLQPHDNPDQVMLRQLSGKALGVFLEGLRFASTRQKVNRCINKMHEMIISGSRLSRLRHCMPWSVSLGFPRERIPWSATVAGKFCSYRLVSFQHPFFCFPRRANQSSQVYFHQTPVWTFSPAWSQPSDTWNLSTVKAS